MKKRFIFFTFMVLLAWTGFSQNHGRQVSGIYRYYVGMKDGFEIWIVDGARIREAVYPEFLYGGNGQRYCFEPEKEIWIDNSISAEEYRYTLAH